MDFTCKKWERRIESSEKINQFFEIVNTYYVEPTFEEYIIDLGTAYFQSGLSGD